MASVTPNKGVLDSNAKEEGKLLISPYPDLDPIFGMDVPIVKGESMTDGPIVRGQSMRATRAASGEGREKPVKRAAVAPQAGCRSDGSGRFCGGYYGSRGDRKRGLRRRVRRGIRGRAADGCDKRRAL